MKREWDLKNAFAPQPESCREALLNAARSVKEEETVKRISYRAVWIAAILLILTMAAAFAAHSVGLFDWFQKHYGAALPPAAQEALSATEPTALAAGPLTITVRETLADGQIAYLTADARVTDGNRAIVFSGAGDPNDRIGPALATELNHPDINESTSAAQAAATLKVPLYSALTWFEPASELLAGEEMIDGVYLQDGSLMLVDMRYTDPEKVGDTLKGAVYALVQEVDPATCEPTAAQEANVPLDIAVSGVIAEKTYTVESGSKLLDCLSVTRLTARQTCAGVYVTIHAHADEGTTLGQLLQAGELDVLTASGERFPTGISLTAEPLQGDGSRFPEGNADEIQVTDYAYKLMITADSLPDSLLVTDGSVCLAAR